MTKEFTITGLSHSVGSALGNFIRTIYLTASSRLAIIGIKINNYGLFDRFKDDSVLVSDVVCEIIRDRYYIKPESLTDTSIVGTSDFGPVWEAAVDLKSVETFTKSQLSSIIKTHDKKIAVFSHPTDISITFYIMNITSSMKETISSACLQEALADKMAGVIPLACAGQRELNCWFNVTRNEFTEDLTIHLSGPDYSFEDDYAEFRRVVAKYCDEAKNLFT